MPDRKITDLVDGTPLQPTDEFVVARAGDNFKIDGADIVSAATAAVTKHDVTISGNTAGALAAISSGTWTLAGGNNITLSQAGNAVTISGANVGGAQTGISGISASDTLYTSGTVRITGVGGGVTVSSNTGQRIDISVAAQSVQPETQTFIAGVSASDTLYTSGNVRITGVGGGITVSSNTGQRIDLSVAAQSVQSQNMVAVTLSGNTSGAQALISSGTMTLAGGNNITVSQNGNAVTISGPNVGGAQTGISGIANSQTTYTSGTVSLSELGAITIRSTTGNQFQFSVNSQSVQPETQTFIAGISASDTLYTSGNVRITGVGGGVTVSSNTGQRVDISVAAPVAATNLSIGVSTGGNTLGNTGVNTGSRFVIVGSNGITASQGTAAGATTVTLSGITQSVQTQDVLSVGVSTGGNTLGDTGVATGSRLVFAGSGLVTASQGTAAGATTVTLNATNQNLSLGVSTGGNTAGNTTVNTGSRFVLVGSGNITASQGTAAGATTVTLSVAAQSAQTGISGIANSQTTYTSGTVSLSELGAITIRSTTGNQFQLSVNSQSVQTNDIPRLGVSTGGNTAGDTTVNSGTRMVFVGSNMVSLSQATAASASTITINATQSVQTQGILSVGASNIGNTSGNTTVNTGSRLVIAGGNNITISQGTAAGATTLTISAPNLGAGAMSAGASNLGNTAGATGITGTQLVLVGSGPVSLSQTTGANGGTLSILAPATSSLSATGIVSISTNGSTISVGAPGYSGGMSTMGNTAGDTGYASQRLNLAGGNNITLSGSTNGGSMTITISAGAGGGGGIRGGVSTGGNTAGSTGTISTGNMVLVGVSPISLSQSTGAAGSDATVSILAPATSSLSATGGIQISTNGSTISIGDGGRTLADIQNFPMAQAVLMTHAASISKTPFYFPMSIGGPLAANSFVIRLSAVTTATLQSFSVHAGFYTMVNSTSMALLGSWSEAYVLSTASSASWSGVRNYVLTGIGTHANLSRITGGDYVIGMMFSAGAAGSLAQSIMGAGTVNPVLGRIIPGTNNASTGTSQGAAPLFGRGSTTVNALPANVVASELVNQGAGASAQLQPWIYIRS